MNHKIFVFIAFLFCAVNVCCAESSEKHEIAIRLVKAYEGMARYAESAIGQKAPERARLYEELVNRPYRDACHIPLEVSSDAQQRLSTPIEDIDALQTIIDAIVANDVDTRVEDAVRESSTFLPTDEVTVCLFPLSPDGSFAEFVRDRMNGVMGFSEAHKVFWIEVIPADGWLDQLPSGVAHEYHHAVSFFSEDHKFTTGAETLLDVMLAEGRAEAFVHTVYGRSPPPWADALSEAQEKSTWIAMQPFLESSGLEFVGSYLFGSEDAGIPHWAGYTIGFRIVQSYLRNYPDEAPDVWSSISAETFLDKSGYDPGTTE